MYEQGNRPELAQQEAEEITIIQEFLPVQLSGDEISAIVNKAIKELGAESLKDMGRMMAYLRENYAGSMDFGKASAALKKSLGGA